MANSSFDQTDTEKILNGKSLSKSEIALCSSLFAGTETTLTALETEVDDAVARRDGERSIVIKLRDLISPVRRLPPEILSEIFVLISGTVQIPPRLTEMPWVLGRVCSQWRTLSRRHPRLWGHPTIDENHIENLECAFDILPPAVNIKLDCSQYRTSIDPGDLSPYLNRCRSIQFCGSIEFIKRICQSAPRNAFQNLVIVHFLIYPASNGSEGSQSLISESAFTWGRLHAATRLEELVLNMGYEGELAIGSLMSLDIHHRQLKVLRLRVNVDIPTLCRFLQQCYSVVELNIELGNSYIPSPEYDNYLYLPELRKLCVHGINYVSWTPTLRGNWQNLRNLTLRNDTCPADRLQQILEQCLSLESLRFSAPVNFPPRPLAMPALRFLDVIYCYTYAGLFNNFFVPVLECLRVEAVGNAFDFDITIFSDMLNHSQCPLSEFELNIWHRPVRTMPFLRNFFTSSSNTIETAILTATALDADILRDIGSGRLLPKLKDLRCYVESGRDILDLIEARILQESSDEGEERTWRFCCYTSTSPDSPEADLLKHLCLMHGIDVKITGTIIMALWSWVITRGLTTDEITGPSRLSRLFPLDH